MDIIHYRRRVKVIIIFVQYVFGKMILYNLKILILKEEQMKKA